MKRPFIYTNLHETSINQRTTYFTNLQCKFGKKSIFYCIMAICNYCCPVKHHRNFATNDIIKFYMSFPHYTTIFWGVFSERHYITRFCSECCCQTVQLNPTISPSTKSIFRACGSFGNPGMRMILPAIATINSAPLFSTKSFT